MVLVELGKLFYTIDAIIGNALWPIKELEQAAAIYQQTASKNEQCLLMLCMPHHDSRWCGNKRSTGTTNDLLKDPSNCLALRYSSSSQAQDGCWRQVNYVLRHRRIC